ncbi:MAG: hypothetical protein QXV75_08500 [Candidatus Bathyarchaeia archaeon]
MTDDQTLNVLLDIRDKITEMNQKLEGIRNDLQTDRGNLWKILALTIIGAFALIGVKLVFP